MDEFRAEKQMKKLEAHLALHRLTNFTDRFINGIQNVSSTAMKIHANFRPSLPSF